MNISLPLHSIFINYVLKTFIFSFLFSLFAFDSVAQFSTILEGKIAPATSYELIIEYQYQYLIYQPKKQLITTNEKGEFNFTIPLKQSTWVLWKCKDKEGQVYLHVGDSLNMQIELGALPYGIQFSGLGAGENIFLQKWEIEFGATFEKCFISKKTQKSN